MSRLSLFNSPLLLGFDHFERALDRVAKTTADGYPPYNVEQTGENALRITLGGRRFHHGRSLGSRSRTTSSSSAASRKRISDRVYLHRGIAARQFQRSFVLADGIEVGGARLENGLLQVDLTRRVAASRVTRVEIRGEAEELAGAKGKRST